MKKSSIFLFFLVSFFAFSFPASAGGRDDQHLAHAIISVVGQILAPHTGAVVPVQYYGGGRVMPKPVLPDGRTLESAQADCASSTMEWHRRHPGHCRGYGLEQFLAQAQERCLRQQITNPRIDCRGPLGGGIGGGIGIQIGPFGF